MTGNIKSCQHKFGEAAMVYGPTTLKHRLFLTKIIPYCHITQYCHSYSFIQGKLKYISRNGLNSALSNFIYNGQKWKESKYPPAGMSN